MASHNKVSEGIEFERIQNDLISLFDGYKREKEYLADTQKAVLNILEDLVAEKSNLENYQKALLNILDDYLEEKNKVTKTNEELTLSNKELESFSYSVSHDLRTPVRAINSFTTLIKRKYEDKFDSDGKQYLDLVIAESLRMGHLIDDLLTFARLGRKEIHKSLTDINSLVNEAIKEVLKIHEVKSKPQIIINDLFPAYCDSALLFQVYINIISNAIKFSGKKKKPVIEFGCSNENDFISYYIKDNGVGFDMKFYDKLFGVFQRLHSEDDFKGTGIGLAIVQRIILRHGGRVKATSTVNEGSTFSFTLPVSK